MSMCDKFERWQMYSEHNKLDALQEAAVRMADDYDVPWPEVKSGVPNFPDTPENDSLKSGAYDPDTNTIYINENLVKDPDHSKALDELGHEFAHELYREDWIDEDHPDGSSEEFADAYADDFSDEMEAKCGPKPPQSPGTPPDDDDDDEDDDDGEEEGTEPDRPPEDRPPADNKPKPGDWNLPAGDTTYG